MSLAKMQSGRVLVLGATCAHGCLLFHVGLWPRILSSHRLVVYFQDLHPSSVGASLTSLCFNLFIFKLGIIMGIM